jgi:hydroxyacylglutathione hydrolase
MLRKVLLVLAFGVAALCATLLIATRDQITGEHIRDNLDVKTITVNNAKIYLVQRSGKIIMIDSGNPGDEDKIVNAIHDAGIAPENIDYLILTHGHLDHLGTAAYFQREFGIKIIGGKGDEKMFSNGEQQPLCATSWLATIIDVALKDKTYPLFTADILIDSAYDMQQLGIKGVITPAPGHTEGTLLVAFDEMIFVGDLIRGELIRQNTPTRHFFMCDLTDNNADLSRLVAMKQYRRWYTGHFGPLQRDDVNKWLQATGALSLQ